MPMVKVLRPFNKTPQGDLAEVGEEIEVSETRGEELLRTGLVAPVKSATKAKALAENKIVAAPENKAVPVTYPHERDRPLTVEPRRRRTK